LVKNTQNIKLTQQFRFKEHLNTFVLVLPWIIVLLVFWTYPLIYSGYLSLTEYQTLTNKATFIGFENYLKLFRDEIFWKSVRNTLYFVALTVPITITISLFLAELINRKISKFKGFWQASYFIPSITSMVVIALIFTNIYSQDGYLNSLLKFAGLPYSKEGFLLNIDTALNSIIAMDIWLSIGYYMVLFIAGMQTISNDLYENAQLSGANFWQMLWHITIPGLRNTIAFVIMIDLIKSFQVFIEVFVMTKGGPLYSTTTIVYNIFDQAFIKSDAMGLASAMAYLLFFFLLIFSFLQIKLSKQQ
jgi:multiple sugar transport system permease protein